MKTCLERCTRIPLGVYISTDLPLRCSSGSEGAARQYEGSSGPDLYDSLPVSGGNHRGSCSAYHDRRDPPGQFRPRVFVVCFDARAIIVYDPAERRVDGLIRTGRGPHALVMDPVKPLAYVAHFTDSYIGLVDLDQSHASSFETIVATIGIP